MINSLNASSSGKRTHEKQVKRDDLAKLVHDSSEKNRQYLFLFLGLLTYVLVMVFSTTDLQLLLPAQSIKLPLIDATLPLIGFYQIAPLFVVGIHFNLLHNLSNHHYKLMRWRNSFDTTQVPRTHITAFIFDNAILGSGGKFEKSVRMANDFLCLYFAPITLALLLLRFTDYQNAGLTLWHFLVLMVDVLMVAMLHKDFQQNEQAAKQNTNLLLHPQRLAKYIFPVLGGLVVLAQTSLTFWMAGASSESFVRYFPRVQESIEKIFGSQKDRFLPTINISPNEKYDVDLVIENRSLRGMNAQYIRIKKLTGTRLELANLSGANMQNAILGNAQLQGAYLNYADLQNVRSSDATTEEVRLQGAHLNGAQLRNAYLPGIRMQGVELSNANMQGAFLRWAQLQGAILMEANMQGANLIQADMSGAEFLLAQVQGANLVGSKLQGARLDNSVSLQGADLRWTQFQGAVLGARMQGSIMSNTGFANTIRTGLRQDVFEIAPVFDKTSAKWSEVATQADAIPRKDTREGLIGRIQYAQANESANPDTLFRHHPEILWESIIPEWCVNMEDSVLAYAANGIRSNYFQTNKNPLRGDRTFKYDPSTGNSTPDPLLIDSHTRFEIDKALCACGRLKDKVIGLQCKSIKGLALHQ